MKARASPLIGTWRLTAWHREYCDTGERIDALGADPVGFLSYGADGRMNVIVLKSGGRPRGGVAPSEDEKRDLFDATTAYSGTYTVHDDRIVHHVDASLDRSWIGIDHVRFYQLAGTTLEISGEPAPDPATGRAFVNTIVFERWTQP